MTSAERLRELERELRTTSFDAVSVLHLVEKALDVPGPGGAPAEIGSFADGYQRASAWSDQVRLGLSTSGRQRIPQVWIGAAGVVASDAVDAGARRAERISHALGECARALHTLADAISAAQSDDARGRDDLRLAKGRLEHMSWLWGELNNPFTMNDRDLDRALWDAKNGVLDCLHAAQKAEAASADAMKVLAHWTSEANAAPLKSSHLTPVEMLVIADAAVPGGPNDLNLILEAAQADRASHRLDALTGPDRERFDRLLHQAASPQERAYLLKALAVGHTIDQVEGFANLIHPHGADPAWLRDHLTPLVDTGDQTENAAHPVTFRGARWGAHKGDNADSVAASVVIARAQVDPLYALQLTTGGHPDDPALDNAEAFQKRLWAEQDRIHAGLSDFAARTDNDVVTDYATTQLNKEVGPLVDTKYGAVGVGIPGRQEDFVVLQPGSEWRPAALSKIKDAIDRGLPVALTLQDNSVVLGGYLAFSGPQVEVLIVGYGDGKLQLYLPDGSTRWLSEDEWFVNGEMFDIHPNPLSVQLPG